MIGDHNRALCCFGLECCAMSTNGWIAWLGLHTTKKDIVLLASAWPDQYYPPLHGPCELVLVGLDRKLLANSVWHIDRYTKEHLLFWFSAGLTQSLILLYMRWNVFVLGICTKNVVHKERERQCVCMCTHICIWFCCTSCLQAISGCPSHILKWSVLFLLFTSQCLIYCVYVEIAPPSDQWWGVKQINSLHLFVKTME